MSPMRVEWKKVALELAIIIAGVMLALAADDSRASVQDRSEAERYLGRIEEALSADLDAYAEAARSSIEIDAAAQRVLAVYRGREVPDEDVGGFLAVVLTAGWMPPPAVSRDAFDDLVATGNFRLLSRSIRDPLARYCAGVHVYEDREAMFRDRLLASYWKVPGQVLGPDVIAGVRKDVVLRDRVDPVRLGVDTADSRAMVGRLRSIPRLEASIADVRHVMVQRHENYGSLLTRQAQEAMPLLAAGS